MGKEDYDLLIKAQYDCCITFTAEISTGLTMRSCTSQFKQKNGSLCSPLQSHNFLHSIISSNEYFSKTFHTSQEQYSANLINFSFSGVISKPGTISLARACCGKLGTDFIVGDFTFGTVEGDNLLRKLCYHSYWQFSSFAIKKPHPDLDNSSL